MTGSTAGIALGSNLSSPFGSREQNLQVAVARVRELGTVKTVSAFTDTAPVGLVDQPRFVNAALLLETDLEPLTLLHGLLSIEQSMGRQREGVPAKGPRVIDLDLLWYEDQVLDLPELTLPHPRMAERAFVLEPLAEIAPGWRHPVLGMSVAEMLARINAKVNIP